MVITKPISHRTYYTHVLHGML